MRIEEIMIRDVFTVSDEATVRDAIKVFIDNGISGVPIVNDQNEIRGFISDGDIMRNVGRQKEVFLDSLYNMRVMESEKGNYEDRVAEVLEMNVRMVGKKRVNSVPYDKSVEDVAAILGKKRIKKLPIEKNGKLVGIISRGDIVRETFKSFL